MDIKKELIQEAMLAQGCADGMAQLGNSADKSGMLQCFIDRIDFCLAKNFPGKDFLKEHFAAELPGKKIYIDEKVEIHNTGGVFLGNCEAICMADGYSVCRIYVKHCTRLKVQAVGNTFVMIDALDQASVDVRCEEGARVVVNLYGQAKADTEGSGQMKIVHKHKETYDL